MPSKSHFAVSNLGPLEAVKTDEGTMLVLDGSEDLAYIAQNVAQRLDIAQVLRTGDETRSVVAKSIGAQTLRDKLVYKLERDANRDRPVPDLPIIGIALAKEVKKAHELSSEEPPIYLTDVTVEPPTRTRVLY